MSALAKARARQALADAGLPSEGILEPLRSVTNEVWLSDEYLIRLNRRQDGRLQKEMAIGGLLPGVQIEERPGTDPTIPPRTRRGNLNSERLRHETGFDRWTPLEQGLRATIERCGAEVSG